MATRDDVAKVLQEMEKYEQERQITHHTPRPMRMKPKKEIMEDIKLPPPSVIDRMAYNDAKRVIDDAISMSTPTRVPLNRSGLKFGFEKPAEKIRLPSEGIFLCRGGQVKQLSGPPPKPKPAKIELPVVKFGRKIV